MQRRPLSDRQGGEACATIDLVAPLAPEPPPSASTDITGRPTVRSASGAVSALIGSGLRRGDVDSANFRTRPTATTPGARTSTTATRTTGTRTTTTASASSADQSCSSGDGAPFSFQDLVQAYFDCRQHKRNKLAALVFEADLERNLRTLYAELVEGRYRIGRSICFVIIRPKPREVWAAAFRDRIVQHLVYNHVSPRFYASFIPDSCACIPGRGTLYAARRLEAKARHCLVGAALINTRNGERQGQAPRTHDIRKPYPTITAQGSQGALVAAFLAKHYTGVVGSDLRAPLGTITGTDHHSLVAAFLTTYYGTDQDTRIERPLPTITGLDRFGLVTVGLERYRIEDIGMRMLQPAELFRAQGFPEDVQLIGSKRSQVELCGNSVCPPIAEALVRANVVEQRQEEAA